MQSLSRSLLLSSLLFVLFACSTNGSGFRLRGLASAKPLDNSKVFVSSRANDALFTTELEQQLRTIGAEISTEDQAMIRVDITNTEEKRTVSGYSVTRAVREFHYQLQVRFIMMEPATERTKSDTVLQSSSQAYDSDYVLGTQEEAEQIKRDLRREAARLLALRIVAFKASAPR